MFKLEQVLIDLSGDRSAFLFCRADHDGDRPDLFCDSGLRYRIDGNYAETKERSGTKWRRAKTKPPNNDERDVTE